MGIVELEAEAPRAIEYRRGDVRLYLYGAHAWLYRLMVGMYGADEATGRFWALWN